MTTTRHRPGPRPLSGPARFAAAAALLALPALTAGCGAPDGDGDADLEAPPAEVTTGGDTEGLQLILGVDQIRYAPNEPIHLRIRVVNRLEEPRTLAFSSGQRVDAVLVDADGVDVLRWSDGQAFTQALGEVTFEPGETGESWELELVAPEAPGSYSLVGSLVASSDTLRASLPVEVGGS